MAERQKRTLMSQYSHLDKIKGIYLHGEPGCGKSQIQEIFFDTLPVPAE